MRVHRIDVVLVVFIEGIETVLASASLSNTEIAMAIMLVLRVKEEIETALALASLSNAEIAAAIASTAEGYAFPTNLDRDPPVNGLAPETQAAFFQRALSEGLDAAGFASHLEKMHQARQA